MQPVKLSLEGTWESDAQARVWIRLVAADGLKGLYRYQVETQPTHLDPRSQELSQF